MTVSINYAAHLLAVEGNTEMRNTIREVGVAAGFEKVTIAASIEEAWGVMAGEDRPTWILSSLYDEDKYNTFQLLGLTVQNSDLKDIVFTLLLTEGEFKHIPYAFELGLLSFAQKPFVKDQLAEHLKDKIEKLKNGTSPTHVAAECFREHLITSKIHEPLADLEASLLKVFPGTAEAYARLSDAQLKSGNLDESMNTLVMAKQLYPDQNDVLANVQKALAEKGDQFNLEGKPISAVMSLNHATIIDSDESTRNQCGQLLKQVGVTETKEFDSSEEAVEWLGSEEAKTDLILLSWAMPKLSGPAVLQRIDKFNHLGDVPVILMASGLQKEDVLLLQELGTADTVRKPLVDDQFKPAVMNVAMNTIDPKEAKTLKRKLSNAIRANKLNVAKQIFAKLKGIEKVPEKYILIAECEMALAENENEKAKTFATECFKKFGEDVVVLNLLGKCYLKLGDTISALKCLNRAHLLSPQNLDRICQIAESNSEIGEMDEAESALAKADKIDQSAERVSAAKASVAINSGDPAKARAILEHSNALRTMIAYMNNRAVSLVQQEKVDKSIELYKNALEAVPKKHQREKDILTYNFALACVRTDKLGEAAKALGTLKLDKMHPLYMKAGSLRKRINDSIQNDTPLQLNLTDTDNKAKVSKEPPLALHCKPGEMRLHLIYLATNLREKEFVTAVSNIPLFRIDRSDDAFSTTSFSTENDKPDEKAPKEGEQDITEEVDQDKTDEQKAG